MLYKDFNYPAEISEHDKVDWQIVHLAERLKERGYRLSTSKSMLNECDFHYCKSFRPDQKDNDLNPDYQVFLNFYDFRKYNSVKHLGLRMTPEIHVCGEEVTHRRMVMNDEGFLSIEYIEKTAERFYQFCKK